MFDWVTILNFDKQTLFITIGCIVIEREVLKINKSILYLLILLRLYKHSQEKTCLSWFLINFHFLSHWWKLRGMKCINTEKDSFVV